MADDQKQQPKEETQKTETTTEQPKAQEAKATGPKGTPGPQKGGRGDSGESAPKQQSTQEAPAKTQEAPRVAPAAAHKTTTTVVIEDALKRYVDAMAPGKPQTAKSIDNMQVMLFRTVQNVLRQTGGDFTRLYGYLLEVVASERQQAFNERFIFRGFDNLTLTPSERKNFERILNLLITTCDSKTRSHALKMVDIDATMEGFRDPDMHQRIQAFYTQM